MIPMRYNSSNNNNSNSNDIILKQHSSSKFRRSKKEIDLDYNSDNYDEYQSENNKILKKSNRMISSTPNDLNNLNSNSNNNNVNNNNNLNEGLSNYFVPKN